MKRPLTSQALGLGRRLADSITLAGAENRPVFVGACPRSGTTMLRTMLNTHPSLAMPRETRFLLEMYKGRKKFGDLRVEANQRKAAEFIVKRKESWFGRFGVDEALAMDRLMKAPPTLGSIIGSAFMLYAEAQGKPRWGDKRPTLIMYETGVFDMFPDAQFVNLVRDPRGAVASMKKLGWYDGNVGPSVELWLRCVRHANRAADRYRSDQFFELRYENLIADPEKALTDICRFYEVDESAVPVMLRFHDNVDEPESKYHNRLTQPVNTATVASWEHVLSPEEVTFIESKCKKLMERYGYELRKPGAKIPVEVSKSFQARQQKMRQEEIRLATLRRLERQPVAARLTPAQRRGHALHSVRTRLRAALR